MPILPLNVHLSIFPVGPGDLLIQRAVDGVRSRREKGGRHVGLQVIFRPVRHDDQDYYYYDGDKQFVRIASKKHMSLNEWARSCRECWPASRTVKKPYPGIALSSAGDRAA